MKLVFTSRTTVPRSTVPRTNALLNPILPSIRPKPKSVIGIIPTHKKSSCSSCGRK